jgi:peptidoglycan hydrolase-like protein with peptidoglycan-binding domain
VKTGKVHPFTVKLSRLMLRVQALDYGKKPIGSAPCTLTVEGGNAPLETDGDGKVEAEIAKTAQVASFKIGADEYAIRIGFLDPIKEDEEPGWAARLSNLGYFVPTDPAKRDADELRSAVEEFQKDFGIEVDGKLSATTKQKLVEVHGS